MVRWTYPILALVILVIIGHGLFKTFNEDIEVAGLKHKSHPKEGRLIAHTKNVTRLTGERREIYTAIRSVAQYPEAEVATFIPSVDNWQEFVKKSIQPDLNSKHVIILPSGGKKALQFALPAIYYAKYYNSPIVFSNELNENTALLQGRKIFVTAPKHLVPDEALRGLPSYIRIGGKDPASHAVELAKYRDQETEFGWGRVHHRRTGYFNYVITTPYEAIKGLAGLPLAKTNAAAILYGGDNSGIPAITDNYIWSQRTDWFTTPSEGPFRHFWILSSRLSYLSQGRIDLAIEKSPYPSLGDVALGPMEAIVIVFILIGIAGALFILLHSSYTLPSVMLPVKIAWALGSMLLPVLGVILYFSSYRRPVYHEEDKVKWLRPQNIQSAAATIMGFGYGAPLMIAIAYVFSLFGFPIFYTKGLSESVFWLGAGMPFMMFWMYVGAIIIAALMVQFPMKKSMMEMPNGKLMWEAMKVTFLSMTAVSLGMMTFSWWMMMTHLPMMPKEDDILWFGTMWLASFAGFLVAWPLNWIMIDKKLKHGNM